jgi:inner membrane protease ATP23
VKNKAMQSVVVVRNVSIEKAMEIVDKVFDRCYYDLEPVGRIPRKYTRDADLALIEGELYGYTD